MRFALLALLAACRIGFDPVDGPDAGVSTCAPDEDCTVLASSDVPASTVCAPGQVCTVNCQTASSCHVDCGGSKSCIVACPETNCDVLACEPHQCFVTCGSKGIATQLGTTATCP